MTMPIDTGGRDSALDRAHRSHGHDRPAVLAARTTTTCRRASASRGMRLATAAPRCAAATACITPPTARRISSSPSPIRPRRRASSIRTRRFPTRRSIAHRACRFVPMQWDVVTPSIQVWNANVQREIGGQTAVMIGYAGSRGRHLLRSNDLNTAAPTAGADGLPFFAVGAPRLNTAWTTIEAKTLGWRLLVQGVHHRSASARVQRLVDARRRTRGPTPRTRRRRRRSSLTRPTAPPRRFPNSSRTTTAGRPTSTFATAGANAPDTTVGPT